MSETAEQYSQRLLSNLGSQDVLQVLSATVQKLEAVTRALNQRLQNRPSPERWSAAHILAHFAEGEIVFSYRIRKALNDSGQTIEAYDQNEWVKNAGYLQSDPDLALSVFQALRKTNVARLKSLTEEQWERYGIHSERGKESIRRMSQLAAGHDINHLRQMENMLTEAG